METYFKYLRFLLFDLFSPLRYRRDKNTLSVSSHCQEAPKRVGFARFQIRYQSDLLMCLLIFVKWTFAVSMTEVDFLMFIGYIMLNFECKSYLFSCLAYLIYRINTQTCNHTHIHIHFYTLLTLTPLLIISQCS